MATFAWPEGFRRIPEGAWTTTAVGAMARKYDTVEHHGWYENLRPTVAQLGAALRDGDVIIDYSGGTGILVDRLLNEHPDLCAGFVIVDSSAKFLRLALAKLGDDPRLAFRHIRYLKDEHRLELIEEVLGPELLQRGVNALVSTNAIHLYYQLETTLVSWKRVLRPNAAVFIQSGNIRNPNAAPGTWIIDETVEALHNAAKEIVATSPEYDSYRDTLADAERMQRYDELRRKYFLPVRPLDYYENALSNAGFAIDEIQAHSIQARVLDWYEFLAAYHEGVLGWVGGSERIDGAPPSDDAVRDRLALMKQAFDRLFDNKASFAASWTYITCRVAATA